MTEKPVKIPAKEWNDFFAKVYPQVKEHQRLGQAFYNHFWPYFKEAGIETWPELFYEKDASNFYQILHTKVQMVA